MAAGSADVKTRFRARAGSAFARSIEEMDAATDAMFGEHSAKGRLQSGATIIASLEIFEEHSERALDQVLSEAAKLIEHRGHKWAAAMKGIEEALAEHVGQAQVFLEKPLRIANSRNSPSIANAVDERLAGISTRLHDRFSEFRDGWTAPVSKRWQERHPFLFRAALLLTGALIALAAPFLIDRLS